MATVRVSNQGELDAAVRSVDGGDTILLGAGTYNNLTVKGNFTQKVTIASAESGRPAVINEVMVRDAGNVELRGLKFDYVPGKAGSTAFTIQNTRNVTLNDIDFDGHISGAYGTGLGLRVMGSSGFTLSNSEISNFHKGLYVTDSSNVKITGNDLRGLANDAMFLGGLNGALISGNDFRGMKSPPSERHKDTIQFYNGQGQGTSSNIVIRDNVIENPEVTHAIFFGNAMAKSGNMGAYFRNILIEDNYIRSAHMHGITMDHGADVTIRNNTLVNNSDQGNRSMVNIPVINISSRSIDVDILGNRVASVPDELSSSWNISGNVTTAQNIQHWTGNYGPARGSDAGDGVADAPSIPDLPDLPDLPETPDTPALPEAPDGDGGTGVVGSDGPGGGQAFRIGGGQVDGATRFAVEEVDFSDGDVILFNGFDRGTFAAARGKNPIDIWNDAGAVRVNSALDLQELDRFSSDVSAAIRGDDVVLRIVQDDGAAEIVLAGLADEFRAADQPDLF